MNVLIKILPQEFIKNHFRTSIFSLDMLLKSSKSSFYNRGPKSPKVQKPIPNVISKSHELGKFPDSNYTGNK